VADINAGVADSSPMNGVAFRGAYLFNAGDVEHGRELWFSDGTEAGTRLVKDINPGSALSSPLDITAVGVIAFFSIVKQSKRVMRPGYDAVTETLVTIDEVDLPTHRSDRRRCLLHCQK
jgi:ELWxxDGT repeat protein